MTESESGVLPLHYTSMFSHICSLQEQVVLYTHKAEKSSVFLNFTSVFLFPDCEIEYSNISLQKSAKPFVMRNGISSEIIQISFRNHQENYI